MKVFSSLLSGFCLGSFLTVPAVAQVTPDGTTSTTVTPTDTGVQIDNGDVAEGNLFHSFDDFSVPTNTEAFFNNSSDISNIFSRVTGGDISNIDGLIRANGTANLFLINPAGILFGENASLQLGGSFYGSTADSILFPDGEFSATDLDNPPLITINAPIGLGFRDNPGDIINRSVGENPDGETNITGGAVGLQVPDGETLAIVGGNVLLDDGNLSAKGGHIELGSVSGAGSVGITETDLGFTLDYSDVSSFGDITLQNTAVVDVTAEGRGNVSVNAKDLSLIDDSSIRGGISPDSTSPDAQAGDIKLNLVGEILVDSSFIFNNIRENGVGNGGNLIIETENLTILNGGQVGVLALGNGDTGNLNVRAFESIKIDGGDTGELSGLFSQIARTGEGNVSETNIEAKSLEIINGGQINTSTLGEGNSGNTTIKILEKIELIGEGESTSGIFNQVASEARGNSKQLEITTINLSLTNGAQINAGAFGIGNSGIIIIQAEEITLDGARSDGLGSRISSSVQPGGSIGNAGGIEIDTNNLSLTNGAQIGSGTFSVGNAGNVTINARGTIEISGIAGEGRSGIFAPAIEGSGDGGNISIISEKLLIEDEASIGVSNFQSLGLRPPGTGAAGNLEINANYIEINNATITAANASGEGGSLTINGDSLSLDNEAAIEVFSTSSTGEGGIIDLNLNDTLSLRGNSTISGRADSGAVGGNIDIDADFVIAYTNDGNGNDIIASAEQDRGGNIDITAESVFNIEEREATPGNGTNDIDASSGIEGLDGTVSIQTPDNNPLRETTELDREIVQPQVVTRDTCSVDNSGEASGLVVKGKGGVPPQPTEPFNGNAIITDDDLTTTDNPVGANGNSPPPDENAGNFDPNYIPSHIKPVTHDENGEPIYIARGLIVKPDGGIILTAYPTPGTPGYREYQQQIGCDVEYNSAS